MAIALNDWISIAAVVIACGSALVSWGSYHVACASYRLANEAFQLSKPNTAAYLIDVFRYRSKPESDVLYIFSVSIDNKSTIQNAVVRVELRLPFLRNGVERLAIFEHNPNLDQLQALNLRNAVQLPTSLPIRGCVIGNFCFEVPSSTIDGAEFDLHILRVRCAEGPYIDLQARMVMDIFDVKHLEEKRKTGIPV